MADERKVAKKIYEKSHLNHTQFENPACRYYLQYYVQTNNLVKPPTKLGCLLLLLCCWVGVMTIIR